MSSVEVGLRDGRVLAPISDGTAGQWDVRAGRRVGPTLIKPSSVTFGAGSTYCYDPTQTRIVRINFLSPTAQRLDLYSAGDGDLLTSFAKSSGTDMQVKSNVCFSADGRRLIAHRPGTTNVTAWTLPEYTAPPDQVPALVRLLTGTGVDPLGEFVPLAGDALCTEPETYRRAFRAWNGLPD